jgi:DNA-binding transcriptional ArsR family regulator
MTVRLLIEAIVRETTVLLAELATSGGLRAPLANVAERVFLELARELDGHGVSRTVSADMFGLALRTYLRRIQRHDESLTQKGRSLWEAILEFIQQRSVAGRGEILAEFANDDEALVRSVLQDLTDSGLVFRSGVRGNTLYRASVGELGLLGKQADQDALDHVVWAITRREGPISIGSLCERTALSPREVEDALSRLRRDGRVIDAGKAGVPAYEAKSIVIPLGTASGTEAAIYDHFHAMVKTIVCKLRLDSEGASPNDRVGGSTYSFEVWPGHPCEQRVHAQLARFRETTSALRREVDAHNAQHPLPGQYDRVTVYLGQSVITEEDHRDQ